MEQENEELLQLVDEELAARPFAPSDWALEEKKSLVKSEQVPPCADTPSAADPAETEILKRF